MKTKEAPKPEKSENATLGSQLSVARLRHGWTVEEAAARTRLHANVIRNLEADRFDKLPSLAYIRGFLRIYARELGLDSKAILREFQPGSSEVEDSILDLRPEMLESLPTRAAEPVVTSRKLGFGVLSAAAVFVLAVLGIQMYRVWPVKSPKDPSTLAPIGANQKTESAAQPDSAKTKLASSEDSFVKAAIPVKSAEPATSAAATPAPATTLPPVQSSDQAPPKPSVPHQLRIFAKKDTWVRIVAVRDGKEEVVFEDTIDEDDMMPRKRDDAWTGDSFLVTTREAADAEIIFNDSNFGTYEKPGPQTFRLPAR
jgi:cytoskeleton protein RodZ